jgi:hypothetical protein
MRSVVSLDSDCDQDSVDQELEAATHQEAGLQGGRTSGTSKSTGGKK